MDRERDRVRRMIAPEGPVCPARRSRTPRALRGLQGGSFAGGLAHSAEARGEGEQRAIGPLCVPFATCSPAPTAFVVLDASMSWRDVLLFDPQSLGKFASVRGSVFRPGRLATSFSSVKNFARWSWLSSSMSSTDPVNSQHPSIGSGPTPRPIVREACPGHQCALVDVASHQPLFTRN